MMKSGGHFKGRSRFQRGGGQSNHRDMGYGQDRNRRNDSNGYQDRGGDRNRNSGMRPDSRFQNGSGGGGGGAGRDYQGGQRSGSGGGRDNGYPSKPSYDRTAAAPSHSSSKPASGSYQQDMSYKPKPAPYSNGGGYDNKIPTTNPVASNQHSQYPPSFGGGNGSSGYSAAPQQQNMFAYPPPPLPVKN